MQTIWLTVITLTLSLNACSGANFDGATASKGSSEVRAQESVLPASTPSPTPSPDAQIPPPVSTNPKPEDLSTCWVAASGLIFGAAIHIDKDKEDFDNSKYPFNGLDQPIATNNVIVGIGIPGDVVLKPNSTYRYKQGGRELDVAIDRSLDSLFVTPGLKVELFKNEESSPFQTFTGPSLVTSNFFGNEHSLKVAFDFYKTQPQRIPLWLKALEHAAVISAELRSTTTVKITKIPKVPCK